MKSRLPSGFGGGGSMNNMIKEAQKIQDKIAQVNQEIDKEEFSGTSGGGAVTVVVYGNKDAKSVTIDPDVVDKDDVEMLQDLIVAAFNQSIRKAEDEKAKRISAITDSSPFSGLSLPGLM